MYPLCFMWNTREIFLFSKTTSWIRLRNGNNKSSGLQSRPLFDSLKLMRTIWTGMSTSIFNRSAPACPHYIAYAQGQHLLDQVSYSTSLHYLPNRRLLLFVYKVRANPLHHQPYITTGSTGGAEGPLELVNKQSAMYLLLLQQKLKSPLYLILPSSQSVDGEWVLQPASRIRQRSFL